MVFGWFKTDTEKKRDDYFKLYEKMGNALSKHDRKVGDAESSYSSYSSSAPYLSKYDIPTSDFSKKKEELDNSLQTFFDYEKENRSLLESARTRVYEQYEHYKNLAIKEAEED